MLYNKTTASGQNIVIVDAGMTDLIRPALYGAKHKIENLTSTEGKETYTIGGPICESSDIFARDIELPVTRRGRSVDDPLGRGLRSCHGLPLQPPGSA